MLPLHLYLNGQLLADGRDGRLNSLPASARNGLQLKVLSPTLDEFKQAYENLRQVYEDVIVILLSGHLCPAADLAAQASNAMGSPAHIHVIDSQSTAVGLGFLVQSAAEAAVHGTPVSEILREVRASIPHIYATFCLCSLTYLYQSGHIDMAQALVGEMLSLAPIFFLEEGQLVPIQKVRSARHLVDTLHEFISEFRQLKHLALIQGQPPFTNEARNLHERILSDYPKTPYTEHYLGLSLAGILGPHSLGLVVMEEF